MPGLYVHIPFCMKKCLHCDFTSFDDKAYLEDDYIEAVIKELKHYKNKYETGFDTLFVGGGTPTFFSSKK